MRTLSRRKTKYNYVWGPIVHRESAMQRKQTFELFSKVYKLENQDEFFALAFHEIEEIFIYSRKRRLK